MTDDQEPIERCLPILSRALGRELSDLNGYWDDLQADHEFLAAINRAVDGVAEFAGTSFRHPSQFRTYRCMLYVVTRALRPELFVETGVHNGLGSAFVLLAMRHNDRGTLHSIDLPSAEPAILEQGNRRMPAGRPPGWLIPPHLLGRHRLYIGRAQERLPPLLAELGSIDVFLHDSDHSYEHMMFEMRTAWPRLAGGGWLLCDNIEANRAWADFSAEAGGAGFTVASFDTPTRQWKHGLLGQSRPPRVTR
jgi:predicted O-methyltransferase YrrM